MRTLRKLILISSMNIALAVAAFPTTAEQGQQSGPGDHGMHHGVGGQQTDQQAPSAGMKGQGEAMMGRDGQGQGMMGRCTMGKDGQGQDMMRCPMMGGKGNGMMHSRPMMEARLAYIKANLAITEAQIAAWNAYAGAVEARHTAMESTHADMKKAKEDGSGLDCMDARIKATEANLESLKALKPITEALYAVLTDEQKEKADKSLGGGCGMM